MASPACSRSPNSNPTIVALGSHLCSQAGRVQDQHHPVALRVCVEVVGDGEQQAGVGGQVDEAVLRRVGSKRHGMLLATVQEATYIWLVRDYHAT